MKTKKITQKAILEMMPELPKINAAKLADIYNFIDPNAGWKVDTEKKEIVIGQLSEDKYLRGKWERVIICQGQKIQGYKFTLACDSSCYSFEVPEAIAPVFFDKLNLQFEKPAIKRSGHIIEFSQDISHHLKNASKFAGTDELREVLTAVLIDIEGGRASIVSTDGHALYNSNSITCSEKTNKQILIGGNFANLGTVNEIEITTDGVYINGKEFRLIPGKFPNYKAVIPAYNGEMIFETKSLIQSIKGLKSALNKTTNLMSLYLNGSILAKAEDVDFENSCELITKYKSKTFPDCEIGFDAKLLLKSLSVFKEKELSFKTEGEVNRGVILKGSESFVLCMPRVLKK